MKVVRRSAALFGFEYEIDGKMFSFCVVAESEVQAKRMAQAVGTATFAGAIRAVAVGGASWGDIGAVFGAMPSHRMAATFGVCAHGQGAVSY